jgi:hypothetical protein
LVSILLLRKLGDVVAIVMGCRFPLVLRRQDGNYELISEAYVYGYMTGDVVGLCLRSMSS